MRRNCYNMRNGEPTTERERKKDVFRRHNDDLHGSDRMLLLSVFSSSFYVIVPPCHVKIFTINMPTV